MNISQLILCWSEEVLIKDLSKNEQRGRPPKKFEDAELQALPDGMTVKFKNHAQNN